MSSTVIFIHTCALWNLRSLIRPDSDRVLLIIVVGSVSLAKTARPSQPSVVQHTGSTRIAYSGSANSVQSVVDAKRVPRSINLVTTIPVLLRGSNTITLSRDQLPHNPGKCFCHMCSVVILIRKFCCLSYQLSLSIIWTVLVSTRP